MLDGFLSATNIFFMAPFIVLAVLTCLEFLFSSFAVALLLIKKGEKKKTRNQLTPTARTDSFDHMRVGSYRKIWAWSRGREVEYKKKFDIYVLWDGLVHNREDLRLDACAIFGFLYLGPLIIMTVGTAFYTFGFDSTRTAGIIIAIIGLLFLVILSYNIYLGVQKGKPRRITVPSDFLLHGYGKVTLGFPDGFWEFQVIDDSIDYISLVFLTGTDTVEEWLKDDRFRIKEYFRIKRLDSEKVLKKNQGTSLQITLTLKPVVCRMMTEKASELGLLPLFMKADLKNDLNYLITFESWILKDMVPYQGEHHG